jgi:hypothetical protein
MKIVHCIALEGNGPTGVNWYHQHQAREDAKGTTGAEREVYFDLQVPPLATADQITELADDAAWSMTYIKLGESCPELASEA